MMPSATATKPSAILSERIHPFDAGLLVATPLSVVTVAGCLYHALHMAFLTHSTLGPVGLVYSSYITLTVPFALCAWYAGTLRKDGLMAFGIGTLLAVLVTFNFRGSFYWPGTFDMGQISSIHTLVPIAGGGVLGLLLGYWKPAPLKVPRVAAGVVVAIALAWCFWDANHDIGMYTLSPYSLHMAVLSTDLAAIITAVLVVFSEQ